VHLVGFIIRIYHDAQSSECQIHRITVIYIYFFIFLSVSKLLSNKHPKWSHVEDFLQILYVFLFFSLFERMTGILTSYLYSFYEEATCLAWCPDK
jgi:polyferredoxin